MDNLLWGTEHLPDEAPTSGGKLVPPVISTTSPARTARTVRVQPKPPFAFGRIGCSPSAEIAVRTAPNSPFAFDRSTHAAGGGGDQAPAPESGGGESGRDRVPRRRQAEVGSRSSDRAADPVGSR